MERLTSRTPAGVANLDYPQNCFYPDGTKDQVAVSAYRQKAIDRLAAYENTGLEPEEVRQNELLLAGKILAELTELYGVPADRVIELLNAEKDGRLVILEPSAKEGGKRPPCFYNDMGQDLCLGFGRGMEDDEPIDRCKECWYCEANRTLREEAEEADDEYLR